MEKSKIWLIISLIVIVSALILRIASPRNRWVCERGQWRAQGSPRTAQPNKLCADNLSINTEMQALTEMLKDEPLNSGNTKTLSNEADAGSKDAVDNQEESILAPSSDNSFQLISPQPEELLHSPYLISGRVWTPYFSKSELVITLQNEAGETLVSYVLKPSTMNNSTKTWFNFQTKLIFDASKGKKGALSVKKKSLSQKPIEELLLNRSVYLAP